MDFRASLIILALVVGGVEPPTTRAAAMPATAEHVRAAFTARFARIQDITVKFTETTIRTPVPASLIIAEREAAAGHPMYIFRGKYVEKGQFRFLDGRAFYDISYAPETVKRFDDEKAVYIKRTVKSYDVDRSETLVEHARSGHAAGRISNTDKLLEFYPIDLAMGLRGFLEQSWLSQDEINRAQCAIANDGLATVRIPDIARQAVTHTWTLDLKSDSIVAYQSVNGSQVECDIRCAGFRDHDGVALPHVINANYVYVTLDGPMVMRAVTIDVKNYSLKSPGNGAETYHIAYPKHSLVEDSRLNVQLRATTTRPFSDADAFAVAKHVDSMSTAIPKRSRWIMRGVWSGTSVILLAALVYLIRSKQHKPAA